MRPPSAQFELCSTGLRHCFATAAPHECASDAVLLAASADRRCAEQAGLTVDQVAPRLSFFFAVGMNFFQEVRHGTSGNTLVLSVGFRANCHCCAWHATGLYQADFDSRPVRLPGRLPSCGLRVGCGRGW